jgi:hypothetical protein
MTTKWTPNEQTRREMEEVGFLTNKYCLVKNWKKSNETFNENFNETFNENCNDDKHDDKHKDCKEWKGMEFYGKSKFSKKHIRPLPILTRFKDNKDNDSKVGVFGHDTILTNQEKRIMVISDGHGGRGEIASQIAISVIMEEKNGNFLETVNTIHPLLLKREKYSGCTLTSVRFLKESHGQYLEITKIGDSPVIIVMINRKTKEKRVMVDSFHHSWENKTEVDLYNTRCIEKGVTPRHPIFARAQCLNSDWKEKNGYPLLFPRNSLEKLNQPFYLENQEDIQEWLNIVQKKCPYFKGGCQSVRKFLTTDGEVIPGYETLNWGSTIYRADENIGTTQLTRTLGDEEYHEKDYISEIPQQGIYRLPNGCDIVVIAGSDGFTDLWWYHQLGDEIETYILQNKNMNEIGEGLFQKSLEICGNLEEYGIGPHGYPLHDDMSFAISYLQLSF